MNNDLVTHQHKRMHLDRKFNTIRERRTNLDYHNVQSILFCLCLIYQVCYLFYSLAFLLMLEIALHVLVLCFFCVE